MNSLSCIVSILDIGCHHDYYLSQLTGPYLITAVTDQSDVLIEYKINHPRAGVRLVDLERALPFGQRSFDIILISTTLEQFLSGSFTALNLQALLKPHGEIITTLTSVDVYQPQLL